MKNIALLYEKYYLRDDNRVNKNFDFADRNSDSYASPFFNEKNVKLTQAPETIVNYFASLDYLPVFVLKTLYPGLVTGIGTPHEVRGKGELKLGFQFDYASGLPFITGSSLKGSLRNGFPKHDKERFRNSNYKNEKTWYIYSILPPLLKTRLDNGVAIEYSTNFNKDAQPLIFDFVYKLEESIFDGRDFTTEESKILEARALGKTYTKKNYFSIYQKDNFIGACITKESRHTPTLNKILGTDSITPHILPNLSYEDSLLKNPTPLGFLKILPGIEISFYIKLYNVTINGLPVTVIDKIILFETILKSYGIGAKTNVGYGQFEQ